MRFGGKWVLLSAMMEKGWTVLVIGGLLATILGQWYMLRLLFLGLVTTKSLEAPVMIVISQLLLVDFIFVLSLFPKFLMGPISDAIAPQFAATLVWEGQSPETIYGTWGPTPIMLTSIAAGAGFACVCLVLSRVLSKALRMHAAFLRPGRNWVGSRPNFHRLLGLLSSKSSRYWPTEPQRIYNRNGQFYMLLILAYFLVL